MRSRRGFSIVEAGALVACVVVVVALAAPVLGQPRRAARLHTSQDNLRFWGQATATYTMDYGGRLPAFSWEPGAYYEVAGTGTIPMIGNAHNAQTWQETDLLRRLTGRIEGEDRINRLQNLMPHRRRSHLVMADHMGLSATDRRAADPQDRNQIAWARDPLGFEENGNYPESTGEGEDNFQNEYAVVQRWPYSSSYQVVPASFSPDTGDTVGPVQDTCNLFFGAGTSPLGNRMQDDVAFPAQKVFMFEWHDRHSADQGLWYAYPQARPNKLMFDGAVDGRPTGEAGEGFNPLEPDDPDPFLYEYVPLTTDPPRVGDVGIGYPVSYRFTRGGLAGIDYTP